jgi:uncharacterized protein (TIGR03437 family)
VALCTIVEVALGATLQAAATDFAVLLGGAGQDYAASVASDAAGNTFVAGLTYSPNFPVTPGAFQTTIGGNGTIANPASIAGDAFVAKLGPDGKVLWATFLGGSGTDYATGVGVDSAGNVIVTGWARSRDFPVLNALQATNNGDWSAFVTKLDPTGSKLIYSTYLGSPGDNEAYGLAVDAAGNAYVTGQASAPGFPGLSSSATGFGCFVTKLNPQGGLVYSFFNPNVNFVNLGGNAAIAVDSAGSAYVTSTASSYYPVAATHTFGPQGATQALVFKLSPDGSKILYQATIGGSADSNGTAIAVDSTGAAYIAGVTTSVDFPLVRPVQSTFGARPLWKSTNGGSTWAPIDNLPFAFLQSLVADPNTPTTLYACTTDRGLFKSVDGGVTWNSMNAGIAGYVQVLAIDPANSQTLYAATGAGVNLSDPDAGLFGEVSSNTTPGAVYKSVNGGSSWSAVDSSATGQALQVAIDAQNPNNVYVVWSTPVTRKSTDGGATWSNLPFPGTSIVSLALDPRLSGSIYAYSAPITVIPGIGIGGPPPTGTPPYIYRSTDGGATWTQLTSPSPASLGWIIDGSTSPSTVYNGLTDRSTDNGATWTVLPASAVNSGSGYAVAVDPSGVLYASDYNVGIDASHDHGRSWSLVGTPVPPTSANGQLVNVIGIVPAGTGGTLYAVLQNYQNSAFVTKLSPDGSSIVFSTLLNGDESLEAVGVTAAEPGFFFTQNWISGIALDSSDNVIVAGGTRAVDFPTANPEQRANAGYADAFVTTLSADGSKWNYSTYYGGSQDESALAVTLDPQGNLVFSGQTFSYDFPVPGGTAAQAGYGDAFVVKMTANPAPAIASVLNGASYQPGIEAGSWVMIQGSNLANTTRTWTNADFTGNDLPTSLSGVSVTIDGEPAFPYYISPTQINVQAPSDTKTGTVNVVVDNNGALSAPATAQLQAVAPAFFTNLGTSSVVATILPSYALVTRAAPAAPGGLVVLWGTGFGATTPAAPAGVEVSGAPATALPTVTVGGMPVQVISSVLTTGIAGVYQITIQLPANVPAGAVAVQASVGGAQTQSGATIFVGQL